MKIEMSLKDVYRAMDTKRWQIVKTARAQSVAEHSYMVAMISMFIMEIMGIEDKSEVLRLAMCHDLSEVYTGDLATPLKRMGGETLKKVLSDFESRVYVAGESIKSDNTMAKDIVKIADFIEALAFLSYNTMTPHGFKVFETIRQKMHDYLANCKTEGLRSAALLVEDEILNGEETTLDDIMNET